MAYRMAPTAVTLNNLEGMQGCSNAVYAAFYKITTDSVLVRSLCVS